MDEIDSDHFQSGWSGPILVGNSGHLRADLKRASRTLAAPDAWIAATALLRQCPLASAYHDFRHIRGLHLIQLHEPPGTP